MSEEDGRIGCPFITPEEWDRRLRGAGFAGCDSIILDCEQPYTYNANIIAKPALVVPSPLPVILLGGDVASSLAVNVESLLRAQNIEVEHYRWDQDLPSDRDIVSFVDLGNKPLLRNVTEEDLARFLKMVDSFQQSTVLWLSPPAQIHPADPHAAQVHGLARTIRSELAMSFATLELSNWNAGAADAITNVLNEVRKSKDDDSELDPDWEYVWVDGNINVSRFHWIPVEKSLSETTKSADTKGLAIGTSGLLQTLNWVSHPIDEPAPDEVNIKMSVVGLNFKDVMHAMGIVNGAETLKKGNSPFGLEGTGRITKVGSAVTNVAIGDRVMTIGCESIGMATLIQRPALLCVKIPDQLSDEEAATMPVVYVTVLMFLVERWKLEKGQSILIHSAAGGVSHFYL